MTKLSILLSAALLSPVFAQAPVPKTAAPETKGAIKSSARRRQTQGQETKALPVTPSASPSPNLAPLQDGARGS